MSAVIPFPIGAIARPCAPRPQILDERLIAVRKSVRGYAQYLGLDLAEIDRVAAQAVTQLTNGQSAWFAIDCARKFADQLKAKKAEAR